MIKLFWIALAGGFGTLARYALSGLVHRSADTFFPAGTLAANFLGCLLFGLAWGWAESRLSVDANARAAVFIGFFGAFTTFSSFAYETSALLRDAQWAAAFLNIGLQNILGIAALIGGLALGRLFS